MTIDIKILGLAFTLAVAASSAAAADNLKKPGKDAAEALPSYEEQELHYNPPIHLKTKYDKDVEVIGYGDTVGIEADKALPAPYYYNYY